ncbi:anti-sigma factor antagonist [Leptospira sp. 96542]|nr:anti-sigma factor antagonist [Leptospira sp. 96542]
MKEIRIKDSDLSYDGLSGFRTNIMSILLSTEEDVTLNFKDISLSLDSSAIGDLMKFHEAMHKRGKKLLIKDINKLIRTVFSLNKLDTILHILD